MSGNFCRPCIFLCDYRMFFLCSFTNWTLLSVYTGTPADEFPLEIVIGVVVAVVLLIIIIVIIIVVVVKTCNGKSSRRGIRFTLMLMVQDESKYVNNVCKLLQLLGDLVPRPLPWLRPWTPEVSQISWAKIPDAADDYCTLAHKDS